MKFIVPAVLVIALLPASVLAGANQDRGDGGPAPNEGPGYIGLVLDAAGKPIPDARISASYRDGPAMVTRSDANGAFTLPGFNRGVNPDEVKISCAKPGYKPLRVDRRPAPGGRAARAVEVECRLQK